MSGVDRIAAIFKNYADYRIEDSSTVVFTAKNTGAAYQNSNGFVTGGTQGVIVHDKVSLTRFLELAQGVGLDKGRHEMTYTRWSCALDALEVQLGHAEFCGQRLRAA